MSIWIGKKPTKTKQNKCMLRRTEAWKGKMKINQFYWFGRISYWFERINHLFGFFRTNYDIICSDKLRFYLIELAIFSDKWSICSDKLRFGRIRYLFGKFRICSEELRFVRAIRFSLTNYELLGHITICSDE